MPLPLPVSRRTTLLGVGGALAVLAVPAVPTPARAALPSGGVTSLALSETHIFSDGNIFVRVLENVRGRDVYIVQGTEYPVNDNLVELLFWIDAFKRASANQVTAVIPFFSYAKGDKKDEPRVSIRARVCADCIEAAGADRSVRSTPVAVPLPSAAVTASAAWAATCCSASCRARSCSSAPSRSYSAW